MEYYSPLPYHARVIEFNKINEIFDRMRLSVMDIIVIFYEIIRHFSGHISMDYDYFVFVLKYCKNNSNVIRVDNIPFWLASTGVTITLNYIMLGIQVVPSIVV